MCQLFPTRSSSCSSIQRILKCLDYLFLLCFHFCVLRAHHCFLESRLMYPSSFIPCLYPVVATFSFRYYFKRAVPAQGALSDKPSWHCRHVQEHLVTRMQHLTCSCSRSRQSCSTQIMHSFICQRMCSVQSLINLLRPCHRRYKLLFIYGRYHVKR